MSRQTLLIKYHYRLGDIIRCFPIARHFHLQGWTVLFECLPQYHGIFHAISYARPFDPAAGLPGYVWPDKILDLQIWPSRFHAFRNSGKSWMDFVYGLYSVLGDVPREIVFDRMEESAPHLPTEPFTLISPFGYSLVDLPPLRNVIGLARATIKNQNCFLLADPMQKEMLSKAGYDGQIITADPLGALPKIIQRAEEFMTVNSAPAIIAGAVRKDYWHIPTAVWQDDWDAPNRKVIWT